MKATTRSVLPATKEHAPLLSHAEIVVLIKQAQSGDKRAMGKILKHNGRLVEKELSKYTNTLHDLDDLFQEGLLSLMRAVQRFDINRGNSFSTYATYWIRQAFIRYCKNNTAIRYPVHIHEAHYKLKDILERLKEEGLTITKETVHREAKAQGIDMTLSRVESALIYDANPPDYITTSMDAPLNKHEDRSNGYHDVVADEPQGDPDRFELEHIFECTLQRYLNKRRGRAFNRDHNEEIIRRRFHPTITYTLKDISEDLGISRERVRQLEARFVTYVKKSSDKELREWLKDCQDKKYRAN